MYELRPDEAYTMPMRSRFRESRPWEQGGMRYGKATILTVNFLSAPDAVAELLPAPFRLADDPLVSVSLAMCEDVDWLAGHPYNLVGVNAATVFDGEVDRNVQGALCLIMWENMTEPILGGREHSGVPKVFGDIPDLTRENNGWRGSVSHFGHPILDLSLSDLTPLSEDARADSERARRDGHWMNYKYIPNLENNGPDVAYVAIYPSSGTCTAAWEGRGDVRFYPSSFEQNPTQYELINLLAALPVREVRSANLAVWEPLMLLDRLPRRLQ